MPANARLEYDREQLLERIGEMERRIEALNRELIDANRVATLGILAGMIAHEFNNLLTPVMSYAHLAINAPDDRELVEKALARVIDGTGQVSKIASSILGFLRQDDQLQTADVNRVVDEAFLCMARDPEKSGVRVIRRLPEGLRVRMRPIALQQVLLNLFINAIQAMKGRGGTLEIATDSSGDEAGRICIRIRDTGPGIQPDLAHKLFEPLASYPVINADTGQDETPIRRTGLGLAVCRRLVEEVGGAISAKSAVSMGTTFTIDLPIDARQDRMSA